MLNKICIITGASSGIGKALAYEMAKTGYIVVIAARRIDVLKTISADIKTKYNIENLAIQADVSIEKDCENIINQTISTYGKIDVLINNAGVSQKALFKDLDLSVIRKIMDINYWGSIYMTKYALPYLLKTKGSLVTVSSISGFTPLPGRTGYCSSKSALHGFMESLRIENLKTGLHVMIAAPEYVTSEIRESALTFDGTRQGTSPREEEKMISAEYVASCIAKGIKRRTRRLLIGKKGKIAIALFRLFPKLYDKSAYLYIKKEKNSIL